VDRSVGAKQLLLILIITVIPTALVACAPPANKGANDANVANDANRQTLLARFRLALSGLDINDQDASEKHLDQINDEDSLVNNRKQIDILISNANMYIQKIDAGHVRPEAGGTLTLTELKANKVAELSHARSLRDMVDARLSAVRAHNNNPDRHHANRDNHDGHDNSDAQKKFKNVKKVSFEGGTDDETGI
jgi:hypothetical protein